MFIGRANVEAETPILWPKLMAKWEPTHLKRPWCWERLKVGEEGDNRGWDGWMASLNQWTWVWVNSRSSWWTGRPGVLQSMGSQRVGHNWGTELNWDHQGLEARCRVPGSSPVWKQKCFQVAKTIKTGIQFNLSQKLGRNTHSIERWFKSLIQDSPSGLCLHLADYLVCFSHSDYS